jgi:hypothetical protein
VVHKTLRVTPAMEVDSLTTSGRLKSLWTCWRRENVAGRNGRLVAEAFLIGVSTLVIASFIHSQHIWLGKTGGNQATMLRMT